MSDKEKLDEAASLNVQLPETDGGGNSHNWTAPDIDSLAEIMRLSGINASTPVVSATLNVDVSSPDGSVTYSAMSSGQSMAKIMAILNPPEAVIAVDTACGCDDVAAEHPQVVFHEGQAEFDHGQEPTSRQGHEYNIAPADFQGRAGLPNRLVNNYGDNAMDNEDVTESKSKSFLDYLKEAEDK